MTVRYVGYLRQSSLDDQGIERQRQDVTGHGAQRAWEPAGIFEDNEVSGFVGKTRPGFEKTLATIDTLNPGDHLVVTEWSRLGRETPANRVRLLDLCVARKTIITMVRGAELDPSTPTGYLMCDQLGAIARFESALKSERQRRSIRQAVEQGRPVAGRRAFGFLRDRVTHREDEAQAIRDGYSDYLQGVGLAEIARDWNARGLRTGQVGRNSGELGRWTAGSVRAVLGNARNAGLRVHAPVVDGRRRVAATTAAVWEPIISLEIFEAVRARLDQAPGRGRTPKPQYLLTGAALCGVCGARVWGGRSSQGRPVYRCRSGGHLMRRAAPVDEWVRRIFIERFMRPDAAALFAAPDGPDVDALRARRATLASRLGGLARLYAGGVLDEDSTQQAADELRRDLATVDQQLAETAGDDGVDRLLDVDDVEAAWDALGTARQRRIIGRRAVVVLHPLGRGSRRIDDDVLARTVEIRWRPLRPANPAGTG